MSQTFELACHDCRVILWIGQRSSGDALDKAYLYTTAEHVLHLRDFLYGHIGHRLEFQDSEHASVWEYESLYDEDPS